MRTWLLDTSVFYWCRSDHARKRLRERAAGAQFVTAASAPLEILAGMQKQETFVDRKRALESLVDLCGREGILVPDGDALVSQAFGIKRAALDVDLVWEGITAARKATDANELQRAVPDYVANVLRSVKVNDLQAWDAAVGTQFKLDMDALHYEKTDPVLLQLVTSEGLAGKEAKMLARLLQAIAITESPQAKLFAIAGLAVRAGAVDEARLKDAFQANDLGAMDALCQEAAATYDGSLDGFIQIYRHYHGVTAIQRPKVGLNDCLDLDPLLYFPAGDSEHRFVTGEDFWLTVVNLAFPGRAIDAKEVARRPVED